MTGRSRVVLGVGMVAALGALAAITVVRSGAQVRRPDQPVPSGSVAPALITNEYAYRHDGSADAVRSPDWIVTSGSLYRVADLLWSGRPDDRAPGPTSADGTDSAVLRAVSTRSDHDNVRVSFALHVVGLSQTRRTPPQDHDGVHIFLRYQSEFSTYYVSVFRRDGQVAIKKKVPGGPSNGGTYLTLASTPLAVDGISPGAWHHIETTVSPSDSHNTGVALTLRIDGRLALDVADHGASTPAIAAAGRVGLRGDNCEFYLRDFRVEPFASPLPR
jgi:hypothetical protein